MSSTMDAHTVDAGSAAHQDGWIEVVWRILVGGSLLLSLAMTLLAAWGLADGLLAESTHHDGMGGLGAIYATAMLVPCLTGCILLGLALTRRWRCRPGGVGMVTAGCVLSGLGPAWLAWQYAGHSTGGALVAGSLVLWFAATAVFSWGAIDTA